MPNPAIEIVRAETETARAQAYNLRYELYVAQQGLFGSLADHRRRWLRDAADDHATIWLAMCEQRVLATLRVCWAGPEGFDHENRETFDIDNFTDLVDESEIAVVSRMLVDPAHRDQSLTARFALEALPQVAARGIQLVLGECEPHLVNRWARLGFRPYGLCEHPVNGTLVRIALVVAEQMPGPDSLVARRLVDRLTNSQRITSESVDADRFWAAIAETLALDELGRKLGALEPDELRTVLSKAHVIDSSPGAALIRKGHVSRTLYVLLGGSLVIADGDAVVARVSEPGELIGEVSVFTSKQRISDVLTGPEGARVLALSERNIHAMIEHLGSAAAKFLLALTRSLCNKLSERARTSHAA